MDVDLLVQESRDVTVAGSGAARDLVGKSLYRLMAISIVLDPV
jgi:hypothetical protein